MKWIAVFLATLTVGCAAPARTTSPALEQAELECAGKGMATLATPAATTTTYKCVAPDDASHQAPTAPGN
jgi:hypothetical protein